MTFSRKQTLPMNEFLVSLFLDDPVNDFRKREALFLIFLMKGAVDIV